MTMTMSRVKTNFFYFTFTVVSSIQCVFSSFDRNFNYSFNNYGVEKSVEVKIVLPWLQDLTMIRGE